MRRLLLRLNVSCNSGCAHCTLGDMAGLAERATEDAKQELERAREDGATEVVFMRGEPTLRPDLPRLAAYARWLGYEHVQLQTNGRLLVYERLLDQLLNAGVTFFEISLFGADAPTHDAIARVPGAFEQTVGGLKHIAARNLGHLITVQVVKANLTQLSDVVRLVASLGLRHVQLNFTRPVLTADGWTTELLPRLSEASPHIREAVAVARGLGLDAQTEAVPLCHLSPGDLTPEGLARAGAGHETNTAFEQFRVVDLHTRASSMKQLRAEMRPVAPECERCRVKDVCPRTWEAYQTLFGTSEFKPIL